MRQHYEKELTVGRVKPTPGGRLEPVDLGVGTVQTNVPFSAELIEAFVLEFLADKYDYAGGPRIPTPKFHREGWRGCVDEGIPKLLILAPRGHAKSTSFTEAFGMAALLFRLRDFAVIFSNTVTQSIEFLDEFRTELKFNEELRSEFGVRDLIRDREDDIIVRFKDGHTFRCVAKGSGQEVRGLKWKKRRPNLVLFDDLEGKEQLGTSDLRKKFSDWFMQDVMPFGADNCLFRYFATIRHFDSLAQSLSKNSAWKTLRYRAHKSFDDFSEILWPEKANEAKLRAKRQEYIDKGDRDGYSQEYLNVPIAEGNNFFRPDDLLDFAPGDKDIPKTYYAAWDFAISKKQAADYTVGVVIGVDEKGKYYVVDVRRGRWDSKEIIDEMFAVQKAYGCAVHWAEAGQIEKTLGPFLYEEMKKRSLDPEWSQHAYFTVEPVVPVLDKVSRARGWQAKTRAHAVKFDQTASWWEGFFEEMKQFPKGAHDDQVDAQSLFSLQFHSSILPAPSVKEEAEEEYFIELARANLGGANAVTGY